MQIDENRNCNCNANMTNNMASIQNNYSNNMSNMQNMMTGSYMNNNMQNMYANNMNNSDCNEDDRRIDCEVKERMLHQIMALDFGITELALYLDTHNDDEKALCLHNRYCKEAKDFKDKYQKVYGPLTIEYPCNKWRWIEEPWPSFRLGEMYNCLS